MDSFRNFAEISRIIEEAEKPAAAQETLPWYAVNVRRNAERTVSLALEGKGYEQYLPLYRKHNNWSDRVKTLDLPLFPGYVFCRFDVTLRLPVLTTPGVISVIGFGSQFVPVPEEQIRAVRDIARSRLPSVPWPFLREGTRIRVRTGALEGLEGFLVHIKSEYRVVVSVPLLQRAVAVEIDRSWIEPICDSGGHAAGRASGFSVGRAS